MGVQHWLKNNVIIKIYVFETLIQNSSDCAFG